ncbi:type VI secretion system Vgr family protein [Massilia sp. 9096]|uniref:type VI secretion system Vgr family protein n=1 Tax=Massilia sp. 9096 TaxID=1500894 RepID=UPI0006925093|nr:type VI secretion system Vgr family protein [Massilia sp. 9096]
MPLDKELSDFIQIEKRLNTRNRPIRLRLFHQTEQTDDIILPQVVSGIESVCGGFEYKVNCVATTYSLPLKSFIGLPASLEFVNDRGQIRTVNGLIKQASCGESDGAISSYQLVICDAMAVMEQRVNTRVFRRMSWPQIVAVLLKEWPQINAALAGVFDCEFAPGFRLDKYPEREQTIQFNESDAAFIRRLLARSGIAWFFRPGRNRAWENENKSSGSTAAHTLVLFDDESSLNKNAAGIVRYHRDDATEQRDSVTRWGSTRTLRVGSASVFSWDYKRPGSAPWMSVEVPSRADQGQIGNQLAGGIQEFIVESPHIASDNEELYRFGLLRMQGKELDTKHFFGEGSVRDFCAGEYFTIAEHPEIDRHSPAERDFVITSIQLKARNNLPRSLEERGQRLFSSNEWHGASGPINDDAKGSATVPFQMRFEAVRRTVPIVPPLDAHTSMRDPGLQIALVVGGEDDVVHCDEYGRVKIRFPATRPTDHQHARGAGASDTDIDSAWVRVATGWAGNGTSQCGTLTLPRVGTEVLVAFLNGDPDKPVIISQLFNGRALPPPLSKRANLPSTRFLSGMRSQEIGGSGVNQLRFDDTPHQISAQLASDDGSTQLNLGWLTHPRGNDSQPRGEGAELRSDKSVAIRGGRGVLITARGSDQASGNQLDRAELVSLVDGLRDIADQLAKLAETHAKDIANGALMAQLAEKLRHLDAGTNAAKGSGSTGGAPIVAISGPAGIVIASGENLVLGAEKSVDLITAVDTNSSAGGRTSVHAAQGISHFANDGGIKQIAACGDLRSEAQDGNLELLAKKVMELISTTDWINIRARQGVRIYGGGSELTISADGIIGKTAGKSHVYAADHQTFAKQAPQTQFPDELAHHDICIPCMLAAARAHSPLVEGE